jgi:hypothetical protein
MDTRKLATIAVAAAVALLTLLIMREAMAQDACLDAEGVATMIAAESPDAHIVHDLRGDDAVEWAAEWNRRRPPPPFMADHVIIAVEPNNPNALVVFLIDGCAVSFGMPPLTFIAPIIDNVLGVAS